MSYSETVREIKNFEEASQLVGVPHHILHLWTKKFPLLQPKKSNSGELGFEPRDISFAKGLKYLLIDEQKPISAVQKILNERGVSYVSAYGKEQNQKKIIQNDVEKIFSINNAKSSPQKRENTGNAFESLQSLKSEMTQKLSLSIASEISTPIMEEDIMQEKDVSPVKNRKKAPEKAFDSFESNWRNFMHNKGKAITPQEVRAKRPEVNFEEADEILFIDEDSEVAEIFTSPQKAIDWPTNYVITEGLKRPANNSGKPTPPLKEHHHQQGLSVETQEKMQHILSKLDILKSELTVTKDVIHKTLKAFGYSGFGDAYEKHDNKPVY